mmetsp:Transcript_26879/g.63575  ORF Transcript_26879/g.63575 Transcript_26879/m.63575 type:complete len:126 (-) Transcript_26879:663-1040(-)
MSVQTEFKKERACETTTSDLPHPCRYSSSHSTACRSRWLVGSSSSSTCGFCHMICAKAIRLFCPPESVPIFCSASGPPMPIVPRCFLISRGGVPGYMARKESRADLPRSSWSTWCCVKRPMRSRP